MYDSLLIIRDNDNNWVNLTGTWNGVAASAGTKASLFVNGVFQPEKSGQYSLFQNFDLDNSIPMSFYASRPTSSYNYQYYSLAFWDKVLSQEEIEALANNPRAALSNS